MTKSLYEILGIPKSATDKEIRNAYRQKAKENHEDKGGTNEAMIEINRAYSILKDPGKRQHYDNTGQEEEPNFEQNFQVLINKIFIQIVLNVDVDSSDLIDLFKQNIDGLVKDREVKLKSLEDKISRIEKTMKALSTKGDSEILKVLGMNETALVQEISMAEGEIEFFKKCLEVLTDYKYKFKKKEMSPSWTAIDWRSL